MVTGRVVYGQGSWLPEDFELRQSWISSILDQAVGSIPPTLNGEPNPVEVFRHLIENDTTLYMLANAMFDEIPTTPPYDRDPTSRGKQIRSYRTMLYLFNHLLSKVPEWFVEDGTPKDFIGFPFNAILNWPMGTVSGRQFFLDPRVNECLRDILNKWGTFLKDPKAGTTDPKQGNKLLVEAGWSTDAAISRLTKKANEVTGAHKKFEELFQVPEGGNSSNFFNYESWDKFFTREFNPRIRPVANSAVVHACESFPLAFDTDVSRRDTFWLKGTPYSLRDMLGANARTTEVSPYIEKFVGGAVYQAYLSSDSYHCWHAPVTGKVVYQNVLEGTYYAESAAAGFGSLHGPDPAAPNASQRYITHVATRGVLIIDTNAPGGADIGLVGLMPVGMSEVSTCEWFDNAAVGKSVTKGDRIGAFHAGGSTHCIFFESSAVNKLNFHPKAYCPEMASTNFAVNSELASL
ncbi:hypothetical protein FQN55_000940 [Onygenales sp. PD_40]|nr:hypothetical protein FQN55_000940 [Onygenales sp. PD_40]KAK2775931.1 hypothetical protein FQN53_002919 [Emmonsiellopsis sp. PD_33]KAK2800283.1 hypothetical protein FQN51_006191 [Onygenales sp. PD_10]